MPDTKKTVTNRPKKVKGFNGITTFPVGDFLIRLKNAAMAKKKELKVKLTKENSAICEVLKKEGFLEDFKAKENVLDIKLAYKSKKPVLLGLKIVSTPGLRIYMDIKTIEKKKSPTIYILNSSRGVITSRAAIKERIGGEIIAEIW